MLQNIGMMYLGHNLKQSDEERQRAVQEESRKRDLDTKLVLAGYKPVTGEQQMGDVGNGPPPADQVSIRGLGSYVKPKEDPRVFTAGGATFVADKEGKLTQVKLPGSDKLPSSDMQELSDLRKTNPNATMEDVYRMRNQFKQPGVSVKVENTAGAGETAGTKKLGEIIGETAGKRIKQAEEAQVQNFQLDQVKTAIEKGASTGFGAETMLDIRRAVEKVGQTVGFDTKDLSDQELIRKTSNELALRLRNPESGLGLTGNTSNQDLNFLKDSVIGLQRTERGNMKIIDSMKKMNKIKVDMAKKQQQIIRENKGVVPYDLDERMMDFVDKYQMFSKEELSDIKKASTPVRYGKDASGRKIAEFADGKVSYVNE
jgi:hypothetical protein